MTQTLEERIAVLEVEFRNMAGNLKEIRENIVGINTTLHEISIAMAEGRGAVKLGRWLTRVGNWAFCALSGVAGGLLVQKSISASDKLIK